MIQNKCWDSSQKYMPNSKKMLLKNHLLFLIKYKSSNKYPNSLEILLCKYLLQLSKYNVHAYYCLGTRNLYKCPYQLGMYLVQKKYIDCY